MRATLLLLFTGIFGFVAAAADPANEEINFLLGYIEKSGATFIRSGKEYTAQEGADHLRFKLKQAGNRVKTAEDFIAGIASKSYLTGATYLVKLPNGKPVPTGPWLTEALARHRQKK
jgi:hypothetical protein